MRKTRRVKRHSYKKKRSITRKHSTRRYRKKGTSLAKGPSSNKVNCCMCGKEIDKTNGLVPVKCLIKNGAIRAHRVCQECWFGKFAIEGVNHSCPGCVKGLPLNGPPLDTSVVVDLTEDD